jgi:large subunit ribosomal protein L29
MAKKKNTEEKELVEKVAKPRAAAKKKEAVEAAPSTPKEEAAGRIAKKKKDKSKSAELREKSVDDLQEMQKQLQKELFALKNTLNVEKKLEKPHQLREKRRMRARILTILRQHKEASGARA